MAWLYLLAIVSPVCLLVSGLPRWLAWSLAALATLHALREARRYRALPIRVLQVSADGPLLVDGRPLACGRLRWRGSWAFISWRDAGGSWRALSFWPDTLSMVQRRELRLAAPGGGSVSPTVVMAT